MSTISFKEKNLLLVAGMVILYGIAALMYKKQMANGTIAKRVYQREQKKLEEEKALIASRPEWERNYQELKGATPIFPADKDVDTHWMNLMDDVAKRAGFAISSRKTGKEVAVGDMYEMPIECKDWEGSLESLVKFMYALNQEGAMLDVRQLYVRLSNRPGFLKGTFTLYCAYMRE